ncbi:ABC transporter ATP-binding protein [Desulfobacterium sp. N47]|uniref:Putative peptide import ATP-binding protein BruAb2_0796 n=1 Tax=uncultured Desulfobacterium sp. TaxID=201089 RepID=E1Y9U9_9BACT|nr:Putative peptide import ATP-binding protein BruAb2_0796 [uncultured Desulfobacterium sp.]
MISENQILTVENLVTSFDTETGRIRAVDDVSFKVNKGEVFGIVGESGCGKSVTALSIMRLLPKPAGRIDAGHIIFSGTDITTLSAENMQRIRGNRISMIFQEPMTALNPVHTIGDQINEVYLLRHPDTDIRQIRKDSIEILKKVGISDPEKRVKDYPHNISGGMRQRVMIAMALACKPDILIADEPTTALDVTIQAQILDLMKRLQDETGMAIIFITHALGVIAETSHRVLVMYAGKVAETAPVENLFRKPMHPYTKGLLLSIPRLEGKRKTRLHVIQGTVPALNELPQGCRFRNRCPEAMAVCGTVSPPAVCIEDEHFVSCYLYV